MVAMVPVVVTPPVVMAPMIMVAPVAIVTDAPRPVIGPDHPAAAVRIIIGIIIIRVVGRAVEETPVKVMVVREPSAAEPGATKTMASALEDRTAAKPAAMEYGAAGSQAATMKYRTAAAAMERCGPTMKSAATVKAAATSATVETTTTTTASAMSTTTADFGRQSAGDGFRRRGRARIDQRQRLRALWNG